MNKKIYCCGCATDVNARLIDGAEAYPHRPDLRSLPFWMCDTCGNFVGCHHKTKDRTRPLGCIPTPELKKARMRAHAIIDPLWRSGKITRKKLYARISERLGWDYHNAETRSVSEVEKAISAIRDMKLDRS